MSSFAHPTTSATLQAGSLGRDATPEGGPETYQGPGHLAYLGPAAPICGHHHPTYGFTCELTRQHLIPAHWDPDVGHAWFDDLRSTADPVVAR